jgi:hypothetical protein
MPHSVFSAGLVRLEKGVKGNCHNFVLLFGIDLGATEENSF